MFLAQKQLDYLCFFKNNSKLFYQIFNNLSLLQELFIFFTYFNKKFYAKRKLLNFMAQTQMNKRILSIDIFRGLTIAFMILVNTPGS